MFLIGSDSHLQFNISKTDCMIPHPDVSVKGENLNVISDFKYLVVILDSQLSFQKHTKKVDNIIKLNLARFRHIGPYLRQQNLL